MTEFALDVRIRNAAIARGVAEFGSQKKLAELAGVGYYTLNAWATLRESPWNRWGEIRNSAKKLAAFLCVNPAEAFPQELYAHFQDRERQAFIYRPLDIAVLPEAAHPALMPDGERNINDAELQRDLSRVLETLQPRERMVLAMRFGLEGQEARTIEGIAKWASVSNERIRQIEARALRKIREPAVSRKLKIHLLGEAL